MWNRREVLAGLGIASAHALLSACGTPPRPIAPTRVGGDEVRTWLREAVTVLRGAFPIAHALAVSRRRTTAAVDVLGAGVARGRCDGVVLTVRTADGARHERVSSDLSGDGIAAAARALAGRAAPARIEFGQPWIARASADPREWTDATLLARVQDMTRRDHSLTSRIVYASALIDIDDAMVWSVAEGHDLEQHLVRIRRVATRVAWNGTRPVVSEAARAWTGGVDGQDLATDEITAATGDVLALMTPGAFADGTHAIVMEPTVVAAVLDVAVPALLTSAALRRPEIARRLPLDATAAASALTLVDDPTSDGAYGGFRFDDAGAPAAAMTLIDGGRIVGRLASDGGRGLRPGHLGSLEAAPSHLRLAAGTIERDKLLDSGFILEGGLGASVDISSDHVVVRAARARELRASSPTGRVFADIELAGNLTALLTSISGVSAETRVIGHRTEVAGQPRWRSIETPWLRGRGQLRAARGRA